VRVTDERSGPFWDSALGRKPLPGAERGTIEIAFAATEDFTNPMENVLGAFQAAMLYDTVGPALLATLAPDEFQSTLELKTSRVIPLGVSAA
jgi:acyl-coenzyme A thioesterase PaaI-like protein